MTPTDKEIIKKFDQKFGSYLELNICDEEKWKEILAFLRDSLRLQRRKIKEEIEGMIIPRRCRCRDFPCDIHYSVGDKQAAGRNRVLSELLQSDILKDE